MTWPELGLHRLPAHPWAEGRERRGTRASETPPLRETGLVLGPRTQTQDRVDSACDGVAFLLPPSTSAFCREIFCVHRSHSESGTCPCADPDPSQQLSCQASSRPLSHPQRSHLKLEYPGVSKRERRGDFLFVFPLSPATVGSLVFLFILSLSSLLLDK